MSVLGGRTAAGIGGRATAGGRRPGPARPGLRDAGATRRPIWEVAVWGFCIFLLTSPFYFTISGEDPANKVLHTFGDMRDTASKATMYALRFGVLAAALLANAPRWRQAVHGAARLWPLAPFVVWSVLSIAWSDEAGTSLHAVAALVAVLMAGYLIAFRLPPAQLAQAVLVAAALIAATSVGYALFLPLHGVHQIGDADQQVHAGAWRGIYQHKNFLGQIAAILATGAILSDRRVVAAGPIKWALAAVLVFLVAMSTSATAFTILPVALVLTWGTVMAARKTRLRVSVLALPAIVLLYEGTGMILHSLHRDKTFTGRDKVWAIAWDSIQDRIVQGYGYNSLTFGDFLYRLMREAGVLDPHSAYLDTLLGLGAIGLVLFVLAVVVPWGTARRLAAAGGGERAAGVVLGAVMIGWLIGGITEASDRPLTPMAGLGLFALAALLGVGSLRRRDVR